VSEVTVGNSFIGIDLLADLRSSAYFEMKEALIHYFSLSAILYRKDFNIEVAAAIDDFNCLTKKDKSELHQAFTIGHRKSEPIIGKFNYDDGRRSLLNSVSSANDYFSVDDLKDIKSLNTAYRRNAKIYHPDSGGGHELMVELNFIFSALQERISTEVYARSTPDNKSLRIERDYVEIDMTPVPHSTWCGWLGPLVSGTFSSGLRVFRPTDVEKALMLLRASIAIDEYELPEAGELMINILKQKFSNGQRDFGRNAATIEASILLCKRLRVAHLDAEAAEVARLVRDSNLTLHSYWGHFEKKLGEVVRPDIRPKVNPLHPRQRGNLERYSKQVKPRVSTRLIEARKTKDVQFDDAISDLGGFLSLPLDPPKPQLHSIADRKILQPTSRTPLSAEQVGEYHLTFYQAPAIDLVKKYLTLRSDMWFGALFDATVPLNRLLLEIKMVADFIPQTLNRTPSWQQIESLIPRFTFMDFVDVLLRLPSDEVRHRLNLLAAIHNKYSESILHWVATYVIQNAHTVGSGISLRNICFPDIRDTFYREKLDMLSFGGQLTLNPVLVRSWRKEWFKAACAPIDELELVLETGWMTPREVSVKIASQSWANYLASNKLMEELEIRNDDKLA
jgi:hypothetical protein